MIKWIAALAVVVWMGQDSLTAVSLSQLAAYRDYLMAMGIAIVMAPWFVSQLDG